jgi:hypothetical protein
MTDTRPPPRAPTIEESGMNVAKIEGALQSMRDVLLLHRADQQEAVCAVCILLGDLVGSAPTRPDCAAALASLMETALARALQVRQGILAMPPSTGARQ